MMFNSRKPLGKSVSQIANRTIVSFKDKLIEINQQIIPKKPKILQLNIGLHCNQTCKHCHVDASPFRTEMMSIDTVNRILEILDNSTSIEMVDITGGAPELNHSFRYLVRELHKRRKTILDRCNLTVLFVQGQEDLLNFLVNHDVNIVASMPCYLKENVTKQRGKGVFEKSIKALQLLNAAGYGREGGLQLDLVYNPGGAYLPPAQSKLEAQYKDQLYTNYGIVFNRLFTITNMPIRRFLRQLAMENKYDEYMSLLLNSFNAKTLESLMCTDTISIRFDGSIYDCDFNQQISLKMENREGKPFTLQDIQSFDELINRSVKVGNHCYGCTAGSGSSCQGAVV